jgi:hypothetical protein
MSARVASGREATPWNCRAGISYIWQCVLPLCQLPLGSQGRKLFRQAVRKMVRRSNMVVHSRNENYGTLTGKGFLILP